jgi:hypothetical protein
MESTQLSWLDAYLGGGGPQHVSFHSYWGPWPAVTVMAPDSDRRAPPARVVERSCRSRPAKEAFPPSVAGGVQFTDAAAPWGRV